ncbi:MAG: lipid A deacylase LpxR family protein [Planctomycetota bacterium]|nr:lipid A deacylase LpxR family protein [Planctomycetota bacterium]
MYRWIILFAAFAGWMIGEEVADTSTAHFWKGGSLDIYEENDKLNKQDRNYTQGIRISFTTADRPMPGWVDKIPYIDRRDYTINLSLFLGQNIYTPGEIKIPDLTVNDQPYAGWLYGGFAVNRRNGGQLDRIEFSGGIVGPDSFAGPTQSEWHRLWGIELPKGWDHQLKNEPTLNINYQRKWKLRDIQFSKKARQSESKGLEAQLLPNAGWALGNVHTNLNAGSTIRFGYNLPDDFGAGIIGDTDTTSRQSKLGMAKPSWSFYLFGGGDGRLVAQNIFLDGNTFTNSHSVDKERFVADLRFGFALAWKRFSFSFTQVVRTREFKEQDVQHKFGSFNIGYRF